MPKSTLLWQVAYKTKDGEEVGNYWLVVAHIYMILLMYSRLEYLFLGVFLGLSCFGFFLRLNTVLFCRKVNFRELVII